MSADGCCLKGNRILLRSWQIAATGMTWHHPGTASSLSGAHLAGAGPHLKSQHPHPCSSKVAATAHWSSQTRYTSELGHARFGCSIVTWEAQVQCDIQ